MTVDGKDKIIPPKDIGRIEEIIREPVQERVWIPYERQEPDFTEGMDNLHNPEELKFLIDEYCKEDLALSLEFVNGRTLDEEIISKSKICRYYANMVQGDKEQILADVEADLKENVTAEALKNRVAYLRRRDFTFRNCTMTESGELEWFDDTIYNGMTDQDIAVDILRERYKPMYFALGTYNLGTEELEAIVTDAVEQLFSGKPVRKKRTYRTTAQGEDITDKPDNRLHLITAPEYVNALNFVETGNAHLRTYKTGIIDTLDFRDGSIFFRDGDRKKVGEAELQNMHTREGVEDLNIQALQWYYAYTDYAGNNEGMITARVSDIYYYLTGSRNVPQNFAEVLIKQIKSFHDTSGVLKENVNGRIRVSEYPILVFEGYDDVRSTISWSTPYMVHVRNKMNQSRTTYKKKLPSGKVVELPKPTHSYLIKSEILTERNHIAVQNVFIIVQMIERAGGNVHETDIKVSTIIERNPELKQRLENDSKKSRVLERAFKKTLELLQTHTYLTEKYKDIEIPDYRNKKNIPTVKNYKTMKYRFKHKGLIKEYEKKEEERRQRIEDARREAENLPDLNRREVVAVLDTKETIEEKRLYVEGMNTVDNKPK